MGVVRSCKSFLPLPSNRFAEFGKRYRCEGEGGDTEIGFNDRYLRDALRAAPVKELEVCINTGSSPCVIRAADGGDEFTYMILPVRLKAGE